MSDSPVFNPDPMALDLGKNDESIPVAVSPDLKKLIQVLTPLARKKSPSEFCRDLISKGCSRFIQHHFVDHQRIATEILATKGKR